MKSFYFRYFDVHGMKREKEILELDYNRAKERFFNLIPTADLYEVVV